jgi:hypothetical protein
MAEAIDPRLVPEALGRTLALRPPLRGADTRDHIAALTNAQVAAALARYDRSAAGAVLDSCIDGLLKLIVGGTDSDQSFYVGLLFIATVIVDPARAAARIERLPEPVDLSPSRPKNDARLTMAGILAAEGPRRWTAVERRQMHLWRIDSEDD